MTDHPANDTLSAFLRLVLAACVVLTLALVAIFIPMKPAKADKIAHAMNANTIVRLDFTGLVVNASITHTMMIKNTNTLYSAFRNDIAQSAMLPAIFCIFALPASCLFTR
jgi:hypothetical protein